MLSQNIYYFCRFQFVSLPFFMYVANSGFSFERMNISPWGDANVLYLIFYQFIETTTILFLSYHSLSIKTTLFSNY